VQRAACLAFATARDAAIVEEFVEVESGTNTDRPVLSAAFAACKARKATLVVAKLDRLSRDSEEIAGYIKRAPFKCADMPDADPFQLQIYAALAEQEARAISARTKVALAAAKARGLGSVLR
jgi:DNA invertase Pin-like site-specific DNA recombinase